MKKLFILGLAVLMVLGITSMVVAWESDPEYKDEWYINSTDAHNSGNYGEFPDGWDGSSIVAEIEQINDGENNNAKITQYNTAYVPLGSYAGIGQSGDNNDAEIMQSGKRNFVRVSQWYDGHTKAFVDQSGELNRVRTRQDGDDDELYVMQDGFFNYAVVEQMGTDYSFAKIEQMGDENGAAIFQDDHSDLLATIYQDGNLNEAVIHQSGSISQPN